MNDKDRALVNAAATIAGIYEWVERINKVGGCKSIEGVAVCNAFIASLNRNKKDIDTKIMSPLREQAKAEGRIKQ